jgi:hypothetical protein
VTDVKKAILLTFLVIIWPTSIVAKTTMPSRYGEPITTHERGYFNGQEYIGITLNPDGRSITYIMSDGSQVTSSQGDPLLFRGLYDHAAQSQGIEIPE